jgi:hypothetical protein
MKATLIFDLVLIAMAAVLISFEHLGFVGDDSPLQLEPMIGGLPVHAVPACLLLPNCPR